MITTHTWHRSGAGIGLLTIAECNQTDRRVPSRGVLDQSHGGRGWWAHLTFTRMNTTPIVLEKKIEDLIEIL
jgi:hypothetical protein